MRVRSFVVTVVAVALAGTVFGGRAHAQYLIKTSDGMGADAELRESQLNTLAPLGEPPVVRGNNNGGSHEMATRLKDDVGLTDGAITDPFPSGDRSSVMYMKFDLSSLPLSTDSYWSNARVKLSLFARNNGNIRAWSTIPGGDSMNVDDYRAAVFSLKGLDPNGTYSTAQEDRMGNAYTASHYAYNWTEGDGQDDNGDPTGITYYNAPGLQPHCISPGIGVCNDASIAGSNDSAVQTLGIYDDFDNNVVTIDDSWHWPNEDEFANYSTSTSTVDFPSETEISNDGDGVKNLVLSALQAYEANVIDDPVVTFIVHLNIDGTVNRPEVDRGNPDTPQQFLNRNYLVVPKEYTSENAAMNIDHALDPQLLVVPEPASLSLVGLGILAGVGFARRRRS